MQRALSALAAAALATALATAVLNPSIAQAQSDCEITGNVPAVMRDGICGLVTAAHGGDAPVNELRLVVTREVAFAVRAKAPDAESLLLTMLDVWMTQRGVKIARVEVYYGRAHLATARLSGFFMTPSVEYH